MLVNEKNLIKDWTGNSKSTYKMLAASNHCLDKRQENDFYATDPTAIDDLLKYEEFSKNIWECAVGGGNLADKLKSYGFNVKCSDIINRGYPGTEIFDFLNQKIKFDGDIITNPPYRYCTEFVLNSLEAINPGNKVAMFLKIQTLEGQERYNKIYSKYPPKTIYVYVKRKICAKNGDFENITSSAVAYAWFVWQKGKYDNTEIKWIC